MEVLSIQNICKRFQDKTVLREVSFEVKEGETHALIGSSGSGKTTLLRIILGLIPFDRGYVKLHGREMLSIDRKAWANHLGYVPQDGGLFPHLSGRQNITLMARLQNWNLSKIEARLNELRQLVELDEALLERFPFEMSGGQKQRIAIMRAAFLNPDILLLDEPMGALDPLVRRGLQRELKSIFKKLGKTVILITHDLAEAVYFADQITLLHEGKIVQTGTYADFVHHPREEFVTQFLNAHRTLPETEVKP